MYGTVSLKHKNEFIYIYVNPCPVLFSFAIYFQSVSTVYTIYNLLLTSSRLPTSETPCTFSFGIYVSFDTLSNYLNNV